MKEILEIQKKAFIQDGEPTSNQRKDRLERCIALIETHDEKIINALNEELTFEIISESSVKESVHDLEPSY